MRSIINVLLLYFLLVNNNIFVNSQNNNKIIIVGAGSAGIAAAAKLFENGFTNITLIEAEARIGGRVYTTKIGDHLVDLGGQWVYGQKDNVAFNMANPLGLLDFTHTSTMDLMLLQSSGKPISTNANTKFAQFFDKYYIQGETDKNETIAKSFGDHIKKSFETKLGAVPEIMNDKKKYLKYLEVFALSQDPAESWYDLPVLGDDDFKDQDGDNHINWKTKGYGTILDILMKRYPNSQKELPIINNTRLNSEVNLINYSSRENDSSVKLTIQDGKIFEADHVIVTIPLGVLKKQHQSLFTPTLPEMKIKAIEGIYFGGGGKVFLLFDKPFWSVDLRKGLYYGFLWNEADRLAVEQSPEKMWVLGITGAEPVEHKPNLLQIYIASKYANIMESISEEKVFNESVKVIERFMGKIYNISTPVAMLRTKWYSNPHFRGTYSYHGIETKTKNVKSEMLEEPIPPENPKILFAGEATSSHRFGTVDGAIESGWAAATKLINFYKNKSS